MICRGPLKNRQGEGGSLDKNYYYFYYYSYKYSFWNTFQNKNYKKTMFRSLGHDVQVEAKANEIYMYEYKLGRENGNDKICKSSLIGNSITQCLTKLQKTGFQSVF